MKKILLVVLVLSLVVGCGKDFEWFPGPDETPDAFSFTSKTGVEVNTSVESDAVKVSGFEVPVRISIINGEYQIDGGSWKSAPGQISANQSLKVRHTTSKEFTTKTVTTVTIKNQTATFETETRDIDTTPEAIVFISPSKPVSFGLYSSNAVTISGLDRKVSVSISGDGEYSVDGGEHRTDTQDIFNGQKVKIFHDVTAARTYRSSLQVGPIFGRYSTTGVAVE